jgi:pyruvate dehydrogenase E1 component
LQLSIPARNIHGAVARMDDGLGFGGAPLGATMMEHDPTRMYYDEIKHQLPDIDPDETDDWMESLDQVVEQSGEARARFLVYKLLKRARQLQIGLPPLTQTRYITTISPEQEPEFPGDEAMELRIRRIVRWNAVAMVLRANTRFSGIGGHLSTYASSASLYEIGFNHFFRGKDGEGSGDQIFYQGHAAPGIYARAFLEGRLDEEQLDHFRRESIPGHPGLSSYPHPRLMPEFWEFPTVSMGLGPIAAVYQARFNRYLHNRGLLDTSGSRVWAFLGDGETDEPESLGALSLAAREGLDNLTFVVNCNLQRLDGPVRGNGKIIQELEAVFRGSGWNVIKVVWAREWDELLARDVDGVLVKQMNETLDGEFQKFSVAGGAYIREHFFGPDPRLRKLVEHLSDDDLAKLRRGGHDYRKVYAAYKAATEHEGAPTVILAKTVKGWTLGAGVEARNITHQAKKLSENELRVFRDRLELPIPDDKLKDAPYFHPGPGSEEVEYLLERRRGLGGQIPKRVVRAQPLPAPAPAVDAEFEGGSDTPVSTTMVFSRILRNLIRDKELGPRIVPIIPHEARPFGMDPLFKEVGIYAAHGQRYDPVDSELLLSYREATDGQVLEEGITEAGSMASFQAAGTAYASHGLAAIPFYIFYSMFGFQRTGDQMWAFADARGRGFLMGATAGRTTLAGEGLQHDDGHSHILASTIPNLRSYDPAFAYELATIVRDGIERMHGPKPEDIFYYITIHNENYAQPARPKGVTDEDILRGAYRYAAAPKVGKGSLPARLVGSGAILNQVIQARDILAERFDVAAEVFSAPSFTTLRRDALEVERWNRLHPDAGLPRVPHVSTVFPAAGGPIVAATDWVKALPDMVARWLPADHISLGTDGFGRSGTREDLRSLFEIDPPHIAAATMVALARAGSVSTDRAAEAIKTLDVDPEKVDPLSL